MSPFDFINSITYDKKDLFKEDPQAPYKAYLINRGLSNFHDTILYANEMNRLPHTDNDMQFQYLLNSISRKKRFSKWAKKDNDADLSLVMEYYGYSIEKAKVALSVLSSEQLKLLKDKLYKGGK